MFKRLVVALAACAAVSTNVYGRDARACLKILDVEQRIECFEGRVQAPPEAASPSAAPNFSTSFDCNKAASQVEILICSDSILAQLDAQMGQSYSQALKSLGSDATLVDDQRRWLASRDTRCRFGTFQVIRACLIQMTTARVAGLTALAAVAPPAQKPSNMSEASPASESVIGTERTAANVAPDVIPVPPTSESQKGPQPISGEATASKVMVESVRSLLTGFRTPNVKFFTYNVDKKELQGFKSDMPILRVVYEERVFFDTDKADLRQEALPVVKSIANTLRQQKQKIALFVAGHTDARGSEDYNQKLSIRRAEAVGTAIRREGSGSALIWRVGFGKSIPIRPNDSERNMGLN